TILDNPEIRNTSEVWAEMIGAADETIDLEQYYISNAVDEPLEPIIKLIEQAARRGVKARIIVDARMAKTYPETINRLTKTKNITIRQSQTFNRNDGVQHAKYFIIDGKEVFIGSQNFDWRALEHIHEVGLRIRHPEYARLMTELFEMDWDYAVLNKMPGRKLTEPHNFKVAIAPGDTVKFTASGSPARNLPDGMTSDEKVILELIRCAKKEINIQLLYYSPLDKKTQYWSKLDNALREAAVRGVVVNLLVSDWNISADELPYLQSLDILPNINLKISSIPEYSAGYIPFARVEHCKYMITDESLCWIGTSNWSRNYFYDSRNLGLKIENATFAKTLRNIFLKSWDSPYAWQIIPGQDYPEKFHGEK
nr:phospholipase D-like domain-containing protein [Candidatus Neomarinimicrobiota bacterium]